jgi:hypothetical protein
MAGHGCFGLKWAEGQGGARLKNFGALDGTIPVLAHVKGLHKTALLKVNIGCVSVGSVQSRVSYIYIQHGND